MADQLLSVNDADLKGVADSIREKSGVSGGLEFPDGFVSAIQGIDTYYAAQDKVPPEPSNRVKLTPANPTYAIPVGTHVQTTRIYYSRDHDIQVTPSTSVQEITPTTDGNFLGVVTVDAMSSGNLYQVVSGTWETNGAQTFEKTGLSFKPVGCLLMLQSFSGSTSAKKISSLTSVKNDSHFGTWGNCCQNYLVSASDKIELGENYVRYTILSSTAYQGTFQGVYYYVIWG